MLADALEGDGMIGMVLISDIGAPEPKPLYDVGCAGSIVEHEQTPDGRSFVVLKGRTKFRIKRELTTDEPYRVIQAQALYEAPIPAETMRDWRDALRVRIESYLSVLSGDPEIAEEVFRKLDPGGLVNYLSASLPLGLLERQSLLECATVEARYSALADILDFKIAEARLGMDASRDVDS
jgi:Lon protease-like protein